MIRVITRTPELPRRRPLRLFTRGTEADAEKLFPQNTIYVYHQRTGGTLILIDPDPIQARADPAPEAQPTPETAPAPTQPTAKRLSDVIAGLKL